MAFPSRRGPGWTATNGTAAAAVKTINYPPTVVAGDTIYCVIRTAALGAHAFPADWTVQIDNASVDQQAWAWRKADGTEGGGTFQVSSANAKFAALTAAFMGATDPTVTPPSVSAVTTGNSNVPDPPLLNPGVGAKDFLWLWTGGWEGEQTSPPAGNPANYVNPAGANSGTGGAVATNCRVAVAERALNAASEGPPFWTISAADDWMAVTVAIHPAPSIINVPVAQVTETDVAQALTRLKTKSVAQAFETDSAFNVRARKLVAIIQVQETDIAQAVGRVKARAVEQVSETDLAQAITTAGITVIVGQVSETDLAQTVSRLKSLAVVQVLETDLAQAVARLKTVAVGLVLETDLSQVIERVKTVPVGRSVEVDLSQAVGRLKTAFVGQVLEADLAQAIERLKALTVTQAIETDLAQAVARSKSVAIVQVSETDLAQVIAWAPKDRLVVQATELDLAQGIVVVTGSGVLYIRARSRVRAMVTPNIRDESG